MTQTSRAVTPQPDSPSASSGQAPAPQTLG